MSKSNDKKNRTDGTIPMKDKNVAVPINSSNSSTALNNTTNKEEIARRNKTNQFY